MKKFCLAALLVVAMANLAVAQSDPVKWSAEGPGKPLRAGEAFAITLSAEIEEGWHIYSFTQPQGGPTTATVSVPKQQPYKQAGPIQGPSPNKSYDANFEMETESYEGAVKFQLPLVLDASATATTKDVAIDVRFQACNDTSCMPPKTIHLTAPVKVERLSLPAASSQAPAIASFPGQVQTAVPLDSSRAAENKNEISDKGAPSLPSIAGSQRSQSIRAFLWLAAVMGALSLLTPCVFPMIPITVSYFTHHAGANRKSAIFTALVYGIGIIFTFTALGLLLALVFGAGGVNQLAANPWVNLVITAIFLGFALSLFGAFFIQAPPALVNRLNALTSSTASRGVISALLMGFTFTLTSFTCTAPFVGSLLVMTARGNWRWPLAGMLAFSTVFAIPFVVLAIVPQFLSRLPRAGGWMVSVKVIMGFLEIAAAMKFLSNADLVWRWGIFTREVVLSVWACIGILAVLYVLGYLRIGQESSDGSIGALRLLIAIVFLSATIWLIPGLFGRQLGELESFLPPDAASASALPANAPRETQWILNDYEGALSTAKKQNKLVFVDFTGYTCTNCRWMEANMFSRQEVATELESFVRVRLYTDGAGELFERQQKMQQEKFGTVALPYYVILRPDGSTVNVFPGLTRSSEEFLAFLKTNERPL